MRKQIIIITFLVAVTLSFLIACRHDPLTPLSNAPAMSFANDIDPIIISNCTQSGCHGAGGRSRELVTYSDILNEVSPGNPHSSNLYDVITSNEIGTMPKPPNPRLSNTQIKMIYLWIAQGAQNN